MLRSHVLWGWSVCVSICTVFHYVGTSKGLFKCCEWYANLLSFLEFIFVYITAIQKYFLVIGDIRKLFRVNIKN